jgi:PAS domain S-box-containing protein
MIPILFKLLFISMAAAIFAFGVFILFQGRKGYLNRLFFICAIVVAYRGLCEGEMRGAESLSQAAFWANASFLRPFALALFLHFMLYYAGFWKSLNRYVAYGVVYLPAALFSYAFLVSYDKHALLVRTGYGWVFGNQFPTPVSQFHLVWALLIGLLTIALALAHYKKTTGDEQKKIRTVTIIFIIILLIAMTTGLLKRFHAIDLFPVNGAIILIVALVLGFLVWRYRILVTPALVVDEIISSMEDGLIIIGNDGNLIKVNRAALAMTGYVEKELYEKPASVLLPLNVLPGPAQGTGAGDTAPIAQFESVITTRAGNTAPVRLAATAVRDKAGALLAMLVLCKDLSPQKKIEGELIKAQKLEAFELLTKSIAHDFNNLLNSISLRLSLFESDDSLPAEARKDLKTTNQAALLAADLLKQFGSFFKDAPMYKTPCDIARIIKEAAGIVQCGTKMNVKIGYLDALPPVDGVHQQLMQVFLNLFINARQAMNKSGTIIVGAKSSIMQKEVIISIKDNGCGMTQEVADRIFQPFFTTKAGGSGLGLAIVASIIKNHNGAISVASAPASGTTFTITLPASASVRNQELGC